MSVNLRPLVLGLLAVALVACGDDEDPTCSPGQIFSQTENRCIEDGPTDADDDGVAAADDCDDSNAMLGARSADMDCDGVPTAMDCDDADAMAGAMSADMDCDGVPTAMDCD
ncbi:MAG: hypothetical protein AAFU79_26130, partial [Myxococcota bacterium]